MEKFTEYLQSKDLSHSSQKLYKYNVSRFLKWYKNDPINCSKKDILNYLDHLQNKLHLQNNSRRPHLIALDHYFIFLDFKEVTSFIKLRGTKKKRLNYVFINPTSIDRYSEDLQMTDYQLSIGEKRTV